MASEQTTRRRVAATLVLLAVGALFLLLSWSRISAPFGDSDEGINGSVWAYNSRSLRELGPVTSAFGARRLDTTTYATHPPLIVLETALAETVGGEREVATRAPAWLASLAALALFYRLARSLGADELTATAAAAATAATPMFFVYGIMLDTPVTSLPFGLGVALLWYRNWRGEDVTPWLSVAISLLASLAGWQAALLVGVCGLSLLARGLRHHAGAIRAALGYLAGGATGLALSIGWGWWASGNLQALGDKFTRRTGSTAGVSPLDVVTFQVPWLSQLLGLALIGVVACALALRDQRYRPLAALSLTIVALYTVLFREAAAGHQYWLYWSLFPTAVGLTYAFQAVHRLARSAGMTAATAGTAVVGLAVLMGVFDVGRGADAEMLIAEGRQPAELLQRTPLPPGDAVYYIGEEYRPDSWILYYTGRHGQFLRTSSDIAALARDQPNAPILILGLCGDGQPSATLCQAATVPTPGSDADRRPERMVTAADLARQLGISPAPPVDTGGPPPLPPPSLSAP
ncbi:MAG: glycosyltransferase family 39 protein [Actinobacteria bacterium]|nr:glycosyltransferase family 39 protein [Actinomycetota bacterium]